LPLGFELHSWSSCDKHDGFEWRQSFWVLSSWTRF
jgi:hypothetical protein